MKEIPYIKDPSFLLGRESEINEVYHGTRAPVRVLRPEIPYWRKDGVKYFDSQYPVVCAASAPLVPTFMALVQNRGEFPFETIPNS